MPAANECDVAIVGAGAAGLATALFLIEAQPRARVMLFEGARRPGAKILVSGGSRCNVTNAIVTSTDFSGGPARIIGRVLRALPVPATRTFFDGLGVRLQEEALGKLFPVTGRSRDVLDALLAGVARSGATLVAGTRVTSLRRDEARWIVTTSVGEWSARAVVLATGGLSLPKTGSDGWGYGAARSLGHTIVPTTPALVPLRLDAGTNGEMAGLSGVSQEVRLDVRAQSEARARVRGSLLWTHFGISGPAALDVSRHWLRGRLQGDDVRLLARLCPDETFESLEARWIALVRTRPRATLQTALAEFVPASVAGVVLRHLDLAPDTMLAVLARDDRRRLVNALTEWPLDVVDSRGYGYAEATAGGVALDEIDPATMESRVNPGLYFVGEILDVDGRIGGFNFQWAWASAKVAGDALARRIGP